MIQWQCEFIKLVYHSILKCNKKIKYPTGLVQLLHLEISGSSQIFTQLSIYAVSASTIDYILLQRIWNTNGTDNAIHEKTCMFQKCISHEIFWRCRYSNICSNVHVIKILPHRKHTFTILPHTFTPNILRS